MRRVKAIADMFEILTNNVGYCTQNRIIASSVGLRVWPLYHVQPRHRLDKQIAIVD